jgi:hypothetical protein
MKRRGRLVASFLDESGGLWELWEEKAAPSIAPKPAPRPYDEAAAWMVADIERRQAEERERQQQAEGGEPWD